MVPVVALWVHSLYVRLLIWNTRLRRYIHTRWSEPVREQPAELRGRDLVVGPCWFHGSRHAFGVSSTLSVSLFLLNLIQKSAFKAQKDQMSCSRRWPFQSPGGLLSLDQKVVSEPRRESQNESMKGINLVPEVKRIIYREYCPSLCP